MEVPKTLSQLREWLIQNNKENYVAINESMLIEGCGIEKWGELYIWYYCEKGERENLNYFGTEEEAVSFILQDLAKIN